MPARIRTRLFAALVYLAFFASGAACLTAEVTWNRMLIVVVGNSLSAAAMIVMVFMGGLGLGSWAAGRIIGKRRLSLVPYLLLELAVGLYVLASPRLFAGLTGVFMSLAAGAADRQVLDLVRLAVTSLALLLPAVLMGATFPAMIAGAATDGPERGSARAAYLYSINTLGAAIGCYAAGYYLLLELGVHVTLTVACGAYVTAASAAALAALARRRPAGTKAASAPVPADEPAPPAAPAGLRRYLAAATLAVGFVSLAYEVLLTRVSILYLGNTISVFSLVLTAFLIGTGFSAVAGTWLFGRLHRRFGAAANRLFAAAAALAGVALVLTPYLLLTDAVIGPDRFAKFADTAPQNPLPILGILLLPVVFIGALLPLAIRMLAPTGRQGTPREAANLYALNTAGGLVGAGLANHVLVPTIGLQATLALLAGLLLAIAALGPARTAGTLRRRIPALGAAVAAAVAAAFLLPDMTAMYAGKIAQSTQAERVDVKLVREGRAATVTVLDQFDPRLQDYRDMYLNGVEEASTRYWHVQLFKLLGVLPPMLHESDGPKDAMVIAFGAGITAGSVLACDDVRSLDVVDLNPDIEGINDLFTDVNGDVFHRARFHFHNDDGRSYLVTCNKKYDVIISDSTHPRAYDSWILYTEEFYRQVKARLKPGGVWAQWVPVLGSMRGELMRIHLNTFRKVFPTATVWYVYGSDQALLVATPEPLRIDAVRLQAKLDRLPAWFRADEYQLDTVERIASFFWMSPKTMDRMIAGETRVNTDDVHYFDKQSAVWPLPPQWQLPAFQTRAQPFFTGLDADQDAAVAAEQQVAGYLGRYAFYRTEHDLHQAWCEDPANGNVRYFMAEAFGGQLPSDPAFCANLDVENFRAMVAQHPDNPIALNGLADALCSTGELVEARAVAEKAVALDPDNGMILDTLGWVQYRQDDLDAAFTTLTAALQRLPEHPVVLYHLGKTAEAMGRTRIAAQHFEKALAVGGDFPEADDAARALELLGR